jgi:hypothetical protein
VEAGNESVQSKEEDRKSPQRQPPARPVSLKVPSCISIYVAVFYLELGML